MHAKHLFIPCALLLMAAASRGAENAARSGLLALFREPLPAAMHAAAQPVFYGENLYEYIDGGAELFHSFGLRVLLHQEFKAGEADLTVDIYDMGSAENAFGVYAAERAPNYKFTAIGAEGYEDEGIVNFLQDRYYVKLAGFGAGAASVMERCARYLSAQIGGQPALPEFLNRLPAEGRKTHSETYIRLAPLGHTFLAPAYLAGYDWHGHTSTVLVSLATDEQNAQSRLAELAGHLRSSGKIEAAPDLGAGAIRGQNSYEGAMLARAEGRYLVLVLDPGSGGEALLDAVCRRLR